jgi:Anti-sigma-K factor rskA
MPTLPDPDDHDLDVLRGRIPAPPDDPDAAMLARLGRVARSRDDVDVAHTPPPAPLWDRIAAATRDDVDDGTTVAGTPDATDTTDADVADDHGVAPPTPVRRARPSGWWLAAAAAVVVTLGVGAVASWQGRDDDTLVASAELEPLVPDAGAAPAEARLVETGDGLRLEVAVTDADLPSADGFHEVWLLDPEAAGMVSLGPLRADERYVLPPNVDFHDFPVVDISAEPPDGDPTHSGASLLRGTLS